MTHQLLSDLHYFEVRAYLYTAVVLALIIVFTFKHERRKKKLPPGLQELPGPEGYPVVGNIDLLLDRSTPIWDLILSLQKSLCERYSKEGLFKIEAFGRKSVFLFKPYTVEALITSNVNINKSEEYRFAAPWLRNGLGMSAGNKWRRDRKVVTNAFHFKILENFIPIFNEHAAILTQVLLETGQVDDLSEHVKACTMDAICETSFGLKLNSLRSDCPHPRNVEVFLELFTARSMNPFVHNFAIYSLTPAGRRSKAVVKELHEFTRTIVVERKRERLDLMRNDLPEADQVPDKKRMSLLDLLLTYHFQDENLMSEQEIQEQLDTFTFAGHDTTAVTLSFALWCIARYTDVQERLHQEMDDHFGDEVDRQVTAEDIKQLPYLDRVVKETLRLYPAAPMIGRKLVEDLTINGYHTPAGTDVWINLLGLHRNEEVFEEPTTFNPDRFLPENTKGMNPMAYLPFSGGPRNCVGFRFAQHEVKIILIHILRKLSFNLTNNEKKIELSFCGVLKPRNRVSITFRPKHV
ncbi:Cytochrome P450 4c3 [Halotydeus destructor]|nr:Cytochrome P450 4c3 [Halotydeus destructor]